MAQTEKSVEKTRLNKIIWQCTTRRQKSDTNLQFAEILHQMFKRRLASNQDRISTRNRYYRASN
ncbi:uncharacterized protein Dyak_GE28683 [Drosophila yakuba]|uniref:Uncharacterized protein n=1 Tax=Drosophila yakuba TaxID=7245 RepID=A0A0R1E5V8_DROYA|nr:uncharacterized protein Dyak_GE28683 [Drosophila yakuba]